MHTLISTLIVTMLAGTVVSTEPAPSPESISESVTIESPLVSEEEKTEAPSLEPTETEKPENLSPAPISDNFSFDIASYTTNYSTSASNANRNYNMELACAAIDGVVLNPGETFSFNDMILSKRTADNDYLPAPAISGGKMSSAIGGGICQVSSTLYNAALYSGMTITNRRNHSLMVGYVPAGADATVSWGTIDFCFRNDLEIPVMIDAKMTDGVMKIRFLSKENPNLPQIKVSTYYSNGYYYLDRFMDDSVDYTARSYYRG